MGKPLYEHGEYVYDIGSVMRPAVVVIEVLENFGGFGLHYYMVVDEQTKHQMRSENSLDRSPDARNSNQPADPVRNTGTGRI